MLAVDPAMVRLRKLTAGDGENGVEGDPRRATAEIGRVLVEGIRARTTELIRKSIATANR